MGSKRGYKDGMLDGPWENFYRNGQLMIGTTYKDGERDGPYEWYQEDGELRSRGVYKDGEPCGEWIEEVLKTVTYDLPC